jgi:Ca2+-transporting ATPase
VRTGILLGSLVVGLLVLAERQGRPWNSMAFTTLCLAQLCHALSAGSDRALLRGSLRSNPWLLAAVLSTGALQLALLYIPPLARFFEIRPLSPSDLALCLAASGCFLILLEADKWLSSRRQGSAPCRPRPPA